MFLSTARAVSLFVLLAALGLSSHAEAQRLRFESCAPDLKTRIADALRELRGQADQRADLVSCMDDAYLVEHARRSPASIVDLLTRARVVKIKCRNLPDANARAHRVYIRKGEMKIDRNFVRGSSRKRIASVIAHETMHNNGLNHDPNDFGTKYYGNTVPEQIEACVVDGKPNRWPGPGKDRYVATDMVGFGVHGPRDWSLAWSKDGTVTAGSSSRIHNYRIPYNYSLPSGYSASDIVGVAVDGDKGWTFVWYRNGYVSAGVSNDLDKHRRPYRYSLPRGYSASDIVGMAIDDDSNWVYAFYRNGRVSAGTSNDLDKHRRPYRYSLPSGYSASDIVGTGIDGGNNWVFAWYKDGFVSAGTSDDLDRHRKPYRVITGR